jgi:hypothetical protein
MRKNLMWPLRHTDFYLSITHWRQRLVSTMNAKQLTDARASTGKSRDERALQIDLVRVDRTVRDVPKSRRSDREHAARAGQAGRVI